MKSRIEEIKNLSLKSVLVLGTILQVSSSFAQYDDSVMGETDQYLNTNSGPYNSEQLNVDGRYDRLDKMRRKLEKKNQQMVRKKIEDVRLKNETRLTHQLQGAFEGKGFPNPNAYTEAPHIVSKKAYIAEDINLGTRLIVNVGGMAFSGTREEIESKSSVSVGFEGDVSSRMSYGVSVTYTAADLVDDADTYINNGTNNYSNYNSNNNFNPYNNYNPNNRLNSYGTGYNSLYGQQGREMSYSRMGIELQGKFYITRTKRFAPYIGTALSVNRSKLSYNQNDEYSFNGSTYGDEVYTSNSFAGAMLLGAEIKFSRKFGALVELKGGKGFAAFGQTDSQQNYRSLDQVRLENLGDDLEQALFLGASLGLFVQF